MFRHVTESAVHIITPAPDSAYPPRLALTPVLDALFGITRLVPRWDVYDAAIDPVLFEDDDDMARTGACSACVHTIESK